MGRNIREVNRAEEKFSKKNRLSFVRVSDLSGKTWGTILTELTEKYCRKEG